MALPVALMTKRAPHAEQGVQEQDNKGRSQHDVQHFMAVESWVSRGTGANSGFGPCTLACARRLLAATEFSRVSPACLGSEDGMQGRHTGQSYQHSVQGSDTAALPVMRQWNQPQTQRHDWLGRPGSLKPAGQRRMYTWWCSDCSQVPPAT